MKQNKISFVLFITVLFCFQQTVLSSEKLLEGTVSKTGDVPESFYGTWLVISKKILGDSKYKQSSVDVWTLSRYGNMIMLKNPVSGAVADVTVDSVSDNIIKFSRVSKQKNEIGFEQPTIVLDGTSFSGVDKITIETYENDKLLFRDVLEYQIQGQKIVQNNRFN